MTLRKVELGTEPVPTALSLMGPPGSGKTMSALRIAKGLCEGLGGGRIAMIDTEGRGGLYERRFGFDRYVMDPPYSPEAWLNAFRELDSKYAVVISDSFSDEHEGIGGLCEMAADSKNPNDVGKWAYPKAQHKMLMAAVRRLHSHHIFLLRASEKLRIVKGQKDPEYLGWQPNCEKNFLFDIVLAWMLRPNCAGHAEVFKMIDGFDFRDGEQLSEAHGQTIAAWIKGETITPTGGQQAVMTAVTIREADGKLWHAGGIWQEAIDAYLAVKNAAKSAGPEAVAAVQSVNHDALMVLQEYAPGPKARASLQAEIDAGAAHG